MIKGDFIEDLEKLEDLYQTRFVKFSNEYNIKGLEKSKSKMYQYKNCCEKIKQVLKFVDTL